MLHQVSDARALASIQDADTHGLSSIPSVKPSIASLISDQFLAIPRHHCRLIDDLLVRSYDAVAHVGCIRNSYIVGFVSVPTVVNIEAVARF